MNILVTGANGQLGHEMQICAKNSNHKFVFTDVAEGYEKLDITNLDAIRERIKALEELGRNPEITRFKGLGEISPDEFKHFIGKDIRLEPVVIGKDQTIDQLLEFYMGKNTPDRQTFILENLVVEDPDIDKKQVLSDAEG